MEPDNPPVVNDPELAALFRQGVEDLYPGQLVEEERWFGSDSFACYRTLCPTLFSFLGIKNPNKGTGIPHHTPEFEIDDDALLYGVSSTLQFAINFLNSGSK